MSIYTLDELHLALSHLASDTDTTVLTLVSPPGSAIWRASLSLVPADHGPDQPLHAIGVGPTATDAIMCAVTTLSERPR